MLGLKIIVCIKSVITKSTGGKFSRSASATGLNPFDRPAIGLANSLIKAEGGRIIAITMGPESSRYALYQAMALGADQGILISDPALKESDTYVTSKVLGTAVQKLAPFDLLLFGTRSADSDTGHVGPQTAQMLELPFLINVSSLAVEDNGFLVERIADGFREKFNVSRPAAFSVSSIDQDSTHTRLIDIKETFDDKTIQTWNRNDLGFSQDDLGLKASPTRVFNLLNPDKLKQCQFINGTVEEKAEALSSKLIHLGILESS